MNQEDNSELIIFFLPLLWLYLLVIVPTTRFKIAIFVLGMALLLGRKLLHFDFSSWLVQQEHQELRSIDLNLLAAERAYDFFEESEELSTQVASLVDAIKNIDKDFSNFIVRNAAYGRYFLFDCSKKLLTDQTNIAQQIQAGVGIISDIQRTPEFLLIRQSLEEQITLKQNEFSNPKYRGYLHKLPAGHFPSWLASDQFYCLCTKDNRQGAAQFLKDNDQLELYMKNDSLQIISFNQNLAAAFFNKILRADGADFHEHVDLATILLSIYGSDSDLRQKEPSSE